MKHSDDSTKFNINLRPHQDELLQLSKLADINANPLVFHIFIELLNMRVEPEAIYKVLKTIRKSHKGKTVQRKSS